MNRIDNNRYKNGKDKSKKQVEKVSKKQVKNAKEAVVNKKSKKGKTKEKPLSKKELKQREKEKKKQEKIRLKEEKRQKKGFFRRFFGKIFLLIFIVLLIAGGLFAYKTYENGWTLQAAVMTLFGVSREDIDNLDTVNVLLLGISEDLDSRLTDTIMLCSYDPKSQMVSMISIPRDTFVGKSEANAKASEKINTLYSKSPEKLLLKVSELTGIKVNSYIVINNDALIKIVDIIGGVEFNVPIDMDYDDPTQDLHIHLTKGTRLIKGEDAELLLRFRHNNDGSSYPASYGDNDFGRMRTQREFIQATVKQSINIKNLLKIKAILDTIKSNVDTNVFYEDYYAYIPTLVDFDTQNNIISNQLPGESKKANGYWFFISNKAGINKLIAELNTKMKIK